MRDTTQIEQEGRIALDSALFKSITYDDLLQGSIEVYFTAEERAEIQSCTTDADAWNATIVLIARIRIDELVQATGKRIDKNGKEYTLEGTDFDAAIKSIKKAADATAYYSDTAPTIRMPMKYSTIKDLVRKAASKNGFDVAPYVVPYWSRDTRIKNTGTAKAASAIALLTAKHLDSPDLSESEIAYRALLQGGDVYMGNAYHYATEEKQQQAGDIVRLNNGKTVLAKYLEEMDKTLTGE
jgi:hypothetical protein